MGARILVVDDEAGILRICQAALEAAGYTVTVASSAFAALAALGQLRPDLVLLDLAMPLGDGRVVARALEATPIRIAVISGADDGRAFAEEIRAAGFLAKPFGPVELQRFVAGICPIDGDVATPPGR